MKKIFSKNAQYQKFEVLQSNRNKRYKYKEFLVEGVRNLNEARRSGWEFRQVGRRKCGEKKQNAETDFCVLTTRDFAPYNKAEN